MFKVTSRALGLIRSAERTLPLDRRNVLVPIDLFVGGLYERSGVLRGFFLRGRFELDKLEEQRSRHEWLGETTSIFPCEVVVSEEVMEKVGFRYDGVFGILSKNQ